MDAIQNYARDLDQGIGQCLLTQSAAAGALSRIPPPHPQVWIHAAQPSGVSRERRTTARPLIRADTRPYFIAAIIQTDIPSAEPRFGMLRNLFQLLAPPGGPLRSYYLWPSHACSRHKLLAPGRQRATSVPPDHPLRNNEENPSITARACHVVPGIFAQSKLCLFEKWPSGH
jgi:hypothetical protein